MPINIGKITMHGRRKKNCLDNDRIIANIGFPIAWKNVEVNNEKPMTNNRSVIIRNAFIANSLYKAFSCPNMEIIASGQN